MEISSTADWQGRLLVFYRLDQAFENDKCRNSDTDFQRNGAFPLVSRKLNWTRLQGKAHKKSDKLLSGTGSKTHWYQKNRK